jgi:hypothetical protein
MLERIWNEYPDGLLNVTEDGLSGFDPNALAVTPGDTAEVEIKPRDKNKLMGQEEMEQLRSDMFQQLK